ncbi:hypothetical protein FHT79_003239 [Rhizobium sp. BK212]|uniref:hypothetical protein n=1 Tax=Rhizobium sp. BK212 TaxID=2587074 RepID=UPI00160EFD9C|nr:hypothetical protein [Rhizobium sp. BK212]MBB4216052.1 hypothetical protein [Rhizobium sp. BK212]
MLYDIHGVVKASVESACEDDIRTNTCCSTAMIENFELQLRNPLGGKFSACDCHCIPRVAFADLDSMASRDKLGT